MGILNGISKFFGSAFFGLGITLLLLALLSGFLIEDVDNIIGKGDELIVGMLSSPEFLESLILQGSRFNSLDELEAACESNVEEECDVLTQIKDDPRIFVENDPALKSAADDLNNQIDNLVGEIKNYEFVSKLVLIGSYILIVLGILFIYLGYLDWKKAAFRISVKGAILTGMAAVYYKLIQNLLAGDLLLSKMQLGSFPVAPIRDFLAEWINPVFDKIFIISIVLAVIFILLAILFYFLKEKDLKKYNKGK